ncbi:unnamed protein product [Closterium sp. NIES-64]|nr:unnamed protein product [Closterium sp. NIES-64]
MILPGCSGSQRIDKIGAEALKVDENDVTEEQEANDKASHEAKEKTNEKPSSASVTAAVDDLALESAADQSTEADACDATVSVAILSKAQECGHSTANAAESETGKFAPSAAELRAPSALCPNHDKVESSVPVVNSHDVNGEAEPREGSQCQTSEAVIEGNGTTSSESLGEANLASREADAAAPEADSAGRESDTAAREPFKKHRKLSVELPPLVTDEDVMPDGNDVAELIDVQTIMMDLEDEDEEEEEDGEEEEEEEEKHQQPQSQQQAQNLQQHEEQEEQQQELEEQTDQLEYRTDEASEAEQGNAQQRKPSGAAQSGDHPSLTATDPYAGASEVEATSRSTSVDRGASSVAEGAVTSVHSRRIDDKEVEDVLRMLEEEAGVIAADAPAGGELDNADRVVGTERTDKPDRVVETNSRETVEVETVSTGLAVQPEHVGPTESKVGELGSSGQAEEGRDSSKEPAGVGEWGGLDSMFDPDVLASFEEDLRREWEYRVSLAELVEQEEEELDREARQQQADAKEVQNEQPDQEPRSRQCDREEQHELVKGGLQDTKREGLNDEVGEQERMQQRKDKQEQEQQQEERQLGSARRNPAVGFPKRTISGMSVTSDGGIIIDGFEDFLMEADEEEAAFLQQQQGGFKPDNDQARAQVHQSPRVGSETDDGLGWVGDTQEVGFDENSLFDPELLATMEAVFHRHDPADWRRVTPLSSPMLQGPNSPAPNSPAPNSPGASLFAPGSPAAAVDAMAAAVGRMRIPARAGQSPRRGKPPLQSPRARLTSPRPQAPSPRRSFSSMSPRRGVMGETARRVSTGEIPHGAVGRDGQRAGSVGGSGRGWLTPGLVKSGSGGVVGLVSMVSVEGGRTEVFGRGLQGEGENDTGGSGRVIDGVTQTVTLAGMDGPVDSGVVERVDASQGSVSRGHEPSAGCSAEAGSRAEGPGAEAADVAITGTGDRDVASSSVERGRLTQSGGSGVVAEADTVCAVMKAPNGSGRMLLESFPVNCPLGGDGKVVLYMTTLRAVSQTFEDCIQVRLVLRALGVMFEERDVSMRVHFRQELKTLMGSASLSVPHLFVRGRYIGGANDSLLWAILVSFLLFSIAFIVFHPHPDADKLSREPRTIEIMNVDLSSNRKFRAARISYDASQAWTIVEGQLTAILEEHSPDDDPVALEAQQFQAIASMTEE